MSKKTEQLTLNQLRDESQEKHTAVPLKKNLLGGYSARQVAEYIETLSQNLDDAEQSFNNRLDEYASMTIMLKQERDQYGEMFNLCKESKQELETQIDSLTKENEELKGLIGELKKETTIYQEKHQLYDEIAVQNLQLKSELNEYRNYEQECTNLKSQLDQLKVMVRDLSVELEDYSKNEQNEQADQQCENLRTENETLKAANETHALKMAALQTQNRQLQEQLEAAVRDKNTLRAEQERLREQCAEAQQNSDWQAQLKTLKEQYEATVLEKSRLLTEKQTLAEEVQKATDQSRILAQQNAELQELNTKNQWQTQELRAEFERRTSEYAQQHQKNIDALSESIMMAETILNEEKQTLGRLQNSRIETTDFLSGKAAEVTVASPPPGAKETAQRADEILNLF